MLSPRIAMSERWVDMVGEVVAVVLFWLWHRVEEQSEYEGVLSTCLFVRFTVYRCWVAFHGVQ